MIINMVQLIINIKILKGGLHQFLLRPMGKTQPLLTTSPWHMCQCLHFKKLKFILGRLGTGTTTFGTRFHHCCTMLYQVPLPWYNSTITLSPSFLYNFTNIEIHTIFHFFPQLYQLHLCYLMYRNVNLVRILHLSLMLQTV